MRLSLSAALRGLVAQAADGEREVATLIAAAWKRLEVDVVDYLEVVDADTLQPLTVLDRPARALVAALVGQTRLIDNVAVPA